MRIESIKVSRQNLELSRPYTISYKTIGRVENAIVQIQLESGITGMGAANPSKQVVGEELDDTMEALGAPGLDGLRGQDIRHFHWLLDEVQRMFPKNPGARAALDIALHDVFTQYLGVPLAAFLGQKIDSMPTSITIGIKNVDETVREAAEYYGRGFRILKVKLGNSLEEDLERLFKLRGIYNDRVLIRVDANQGYTPNQLIKFFDRARGLDIELIEQPLAAGAISELKQLPSSIKKQVAADESLISPADAFKLAETPIACGIFNIKLMKCGGLLPAFQIANIAQQAGIELMWGCNDESIISITAALHAALSCPHTKYIDLDGSLDLARDVVNGGFIIKDGLMSINGLPGLGITPTEFMRS